MPLLTITKTYQDGDILTEADLDAIRNDVISFINVTKLDDSNLQDAAVTEDKIQDQAVTEDKIADNAVTSDKIPLTLRGGLIGTVVSFHTFGGALSIPRGFMKMNGNVVNQANYDAIHGAGAYVTDGIAASALLTRNLPNAESRYLTGVATTTQDGTGVFSYAGNAGNQVSIAHTHTIPAHNHQWYNYTNNADANAWDSTGSTETINTGVLDVDDGAGLVFSTGEDGERILGEDLYTNNQTLTTNSGGSTTQNIRPDSVEVIMLIKVI
jgi:hypothetical protein